MREEAPLKVDRLRGHVIVEVDDECWMYEDGVLVKDDEGRNCGRCNRPRTAQGHDGCLGELPGLINACCGHGLTQDAYVQYPSGNCIRGWRAVLVQAWLKFYRRMFSSWL